jgi:hypothetical protein
MDFNTPGKHIGAALSADQARMKIRVHYFGRILQANDMFAEKWTFKLHDGFLPSRLRVWPGIRLLDIKIWSPGRLWMDSKSCQESARERTGSSAYSDESDPLFSSGLTNLRACSSRSIDRNGHSTSHCTVLNLTARSIRYSVHRRPFYDWLMRSKDGKFSKYSKYSKYSALQSHRAAEKSRT